jgi:hypothetical protein
VAAKVGAVRLIDNDGACGVAPDPVGGDALVLVKTGEER